VSDGFSDCAELAVSLEFLSVLEAENLRRLYVCHGSAYSRRLTLYSFFRHLNPMIALLDPDRECVLSGMTARRGRTDGRQFMIALTCVKPRHSCSLPCSLWRRSLSIASYINHSSPMLK
jgi:hypothetical protein